MKIDPITIIAKDDVLSKDRFFKEIVLDEEYKLARNDELLDQQVVLDIGACAGEFSLYIYNQAKIIYAIEPVKSQYDELLGLIGKYMDLIFMQPNNL